MNFTYPLGTAAIWRTESRLRQRGFTLIELAIAIAVVGLVLGASLIPLRALNEARQLQDENRRLETVRDAIAGYALRHRTRARTVRFVAVRLDPDNPAGAWEFRLPAGRPYLPCPDADGDGFEDREGFDQGADMHPDSTDVTIGHHPIAQDTLFFGRNTGSFIEPPVPPHGECLRSRGTVPWRTLGVAPSDGWGNRHTYYADPIFSNATFGFDRQTIADRFDPRLPDASGYDAVRIGHILPGVSTDGCPAVICDGARAREGAGCERGRPHLQCGFFETDGLILKAGAVARATINASPGGKRFPAGSVTDGLPFLLVSHGPNGRFAVNHWATLTDTGGQNRIGEFFKRNICNSAGEERPGFNETTVPFEDQALVHEAMNGSRILPSIATGNCLVFLLLQDGTTQDFHLSFFAWEPPGVSRRGEFDDLLLWMTREELSLAVPGRIPPLPPMVIAYFP